LFKAGPEGDRGDSISDIYLRLFQGTKKCYRRKRRDSETVARKSRYSAESPLSRGCLPSTSLAAILLKGGLLFSKHG
jgi:hypothetical protein